MRIIVPAADPPAGPSFFVMPVIHPPPAQKASKFRLPDSFSASPSAFTPGRHVRRWICTAKHAAIGKWPLFQERPPRSLPSLVQLTAEARPGGCGQTVGWEAGHTPLPPLTIMPSWTPGGRSCSSGLPGPPSCQYRQAKLNKDVYWQPNERIGPGDLTLMNGPPRCFQ